MRKIKKILVVDDDDRWQDQIKSILQDDYEIVTVTTPEEAENLISAEAFDLVILDQKLPGISGIELLRQFRKTAAHLPAIMLTAYADVDDAVKSLKTGAADYIQKGKLDLAQNLRDTVERVLDESNKPVLRKSKIKVFLSYTNENLQQVKVLHERLIKAGVIPWLDKVDLLVGQQWEHQLPNAIKKSDFFIPCISRYMVNKIGYIQHELEIALEVQSRFPKNRVFIMPALLEDCEIPEILKRFQYAKIFEAGGFDKLCYSLIKESKR